MNVYDFDKTIINGDTTEQFFLFCLRHYPAKAPRLLTAMAQLGGLVLGVDKTTCKERYYRMWLPCIPDIDSALERFWAQHERQIKKWYLAQKRPDDIIISASPEFLLQPMCSRLGVRLIASRVDKHTGVCTGQNCRDEEKVRRLEQQYPELLDSVECFYSDSHADDPLARIARRAYIVTGERLKPWVF